MQRLPDYLFYICTMEVTSELVQNLANLSRLHFTEEEKEWIKKDLERMIAFVDKLKEVDVEGIEPLLLMSDRVNNLREDTISGSVSREKALKNASAQDGTFFRVPKVIKK